MFGILLHTSHGATAAAEVLKRANSASPALCGNFANLAKACCSNCRTRSRLRPGTSPISWSVCGSVRVQPVAPPHNQGLACGEVTEAGSHAAADLRFRHEHLGRQGLGIFHDLLERHAVVGERLL